MRKDYDIGIIGLGVAGLSALIQLLDDEVISCSVRRLFIVDVNPILDSNIHVYADKDLYLNTSACLNSLLVNEKDHFYHWLIKNQQNLEREQFTFFPVKPTDFHPRKVFAYYMQDLFDIYLEKAKKLGIEVLLIRSYVKSIEETESAKFRLKMINGDSITVAYVISAIGNSKCVDHYSHLNYCPNYIEKPYVPRDRYHEIAKQKTILVLGSMLSAVDALLILIKHPLKITLSSVSGTFPAVRTSYMDDVFKYKELLKYNSIVELLDHFHGLVDAAYGDDKDKENVDYRSKDDSWCLYVAPLLDRINELWDSASQKDKEKFNAEYQLFNTKRFLSAIPDIVADKLLPKIIDGEICLRPGLASVIYETDTAKYKATYLNGAVSYFDGCINATAATDNSKCNLTVQPFAHKRNFHILGDFNTHNFINKGIFLFLREVQQRIIPSIKNDLYNVGVKHD